MNPTFTRPFFLLLFLFISLLASGQAAIDWQKSIGTENSDTALKMFKDQQGNLLVIGSEPHADFAGNFRNYMVFVKLDTEGNQIWKTYHDIAYETFNPPLDYSIGAHFFTEEFGEKTINLVISINNRILSVKFLEATGNFYTYEDLSSPLIDIQPNNDKVYAVTQCSYQFACYGPDSLIVQKFDPTPDSLIFNPIKWTYEVRQNIRTAQIQGHYDFDGQDIRQDSAGNVYLLIQIERWDFQFCTDCGDAFVDAWCEVFKFSPDGHFLKHKRIATSKAVVSSMRFVDFSDDNMIIRVDDINAANTALVTSIYHVDPELNITRSFNLGRQHVFIETDAEKNLYTCTNIYDLSDPAIHGLSDVLISKYNANGVLLWKKNFGGSSWDWPRGFALTNENEPAFLAYTDSHDFDVETSLGAEDLWVVKLSEETTAVEPIDEEAGLIIFPNPVTDEIHIFNVSNVKQLEIYDLFGRLMKSIPVGADQLNIDVFGLTPGNYWIKGERAGEALVSRFVIQ